jgi:hypothetical protein
MRQTQVTKIKCLLECGSSSFPKKEEETGMKLYQGEQTVARIPLSRKG